MTGEDGGRGTATDPHALFWALHTGLPREGVGSDATTRTLLELTGPLPPRPRALDVGCGPGRSALVLAGAGAHVTAVDTHEPFLRRLRAAAREQRRRGTVHAVRASMTALPLADGCFDLVWCEGAAYLMGVDAALSAWRRLLAPRGALVFTDAAWTGARPSPEAAEFWAAAYPGMRTVAATRAVAERAGFDVVAVHRLPESDWWDEYYDPLAARIDARIEARSTAMPRPDEATAAALAEQRAEIDLRRRHPEDYGYAGYVLRAS